MSKIQDAIKRVQSGQKRVFSGRPDIVENDDVIRAIADPDESIRKIDVDWKSIRDAGILARIGANEPLARQFRDIKRPLIANAFGKKVTRVENGKLIMVTSSLSGEGKTFVTFNLARSMAQEADYSVLLVDADVAKPHASGLLGVSEERGLLDLLEDSGSPLSSAILDTDLDGFSILPAGKPRANATELLAGLRMEKLIAALASLDRNRIILFDSPPLLQTSEAKVLAGFVGQIVLVVGADSTPRDAVAESLQLLDDSDIVNLVLNKSSAQVSSGGYGYGDMSGDEWARDEESVDGSVKALPEGAGEQQ